MRLKNIAGFILIILGTLLLITEFLGKGFCSRVCILGIECSSELLRCMAPFVVIFLAFIIIGIVLIKSKTKKSKSRR